MESVRFVAVLFLGSTLPSVHCQQKAERKGYNDCLASWTTGSFALTSRVVQPKGPEYSRTSAAFGLSKKLRVPISLFEETSYMCVYIYTYIYIHMCIYIYIYIHMCICLKVPFRIVLTCWFFKRGFGMNVGIPQRKL